MGPTDPLWSGRIQGEMAEAMVPLNRSLAVDIRLWPQDIRGSQAWARALVRAGVLEDEEGTALVDGLDRVATRLSESDHSDEADEDIHSLVERLLYEEVGEVAGKLHTGRSRNDQVATDFRLWGMDAAERLVRILGEVESALLDWATQSVEIILPGYTHLQQGQPIRAAHWILSHFWPLERDRAALRAVRDQAGVLPLGSGAIAGCPFPIDREFLRAHLGFLRISENSIDAVSDRDWALEFAFATARVGIHLSRLAEDLVLFGSKEFGFVRLSDGFSTGSSLMPQKRNPDVAELVRGKSGRLTGNLVSLLTVLKGLPTGYNRDLQEDKGVLFDSMDTLTIVLPAIEGAIRGAEFQTDHIEAALDPQLLATDLADYLVRAGVPFRKAHEVVATIVRRAEDQGIPVDQLALEVFQEAYSGLDSDVFQVFDWERSVEAREALGGTARKAVLDQIMAAQTRL
ncbi:MAG: argininosuccinate lyase [Gemmatimonadota bacterium]|nr:argininosuccinate lyase [Gemmatimonadota bacterium]